jgi:hypothetical protein
MNDEVQAILSKCQQQIKEVLIKVRKKNSLKKSKAWQSQRTVTARGGKKPQSVLHVYEQLLAKNTTVKKSISSYLTTIRKAKRVTRAQARNVQDDAAASPVTKPDSHYLAKSKKTRGPQQSCETSKERSNSRDDSLGVAKMTASKTQLVSPVSRQFAETLFGKAKPVLTSPREAVNSSAKDAWLRRNIAQVMPPSTASFGKRSINASLSQREASSKGIKIHRGQASSSLLLAMRKQKKPQHPDTTQANSPRPSFFIQSLVPSKKGKRETSASRVSITDDSQRLLLSFRSLAKPDILYLNDLQNGYYTPQVAPQEQPFAIGNLIKNSVFDLGHSLMTKPMQNASYFFNHRRLGIPTVETSSGLAPFRAGMQSP